jgi:molecular chaperone GrpE
VTASYGGRTEDPDRLVDDPDAVVVNDRRRVDPETGQLREPAAAPPAQPGEQQPAAPQTETEALQAEEDRLAAELTADLQRISAEYANYRKRVERDRVAVVEMATAGLLSGLLPVLDDIERAREHGDVQGAFKGVADALEALTAKLGLERFGEPGEPFDPAVHEALMQAEPDPTATVATCAAVLQPGYRLAAGSDTKAGRVLRPARVSVAEPGAEAAPAHEDAAQQDAVQDEQE